MELMLNNISKRYGKIQALRGFTACLTPGIYALLGPNGSGKSTLMNIITDNVRADGGTITFNGENVLSMGECFRQKLGYMPQYPGMYEHFSAWAYLDYMATLKGVGNHLPRGERQSYVQAQLIEVLSAVDLADVAHRKIGGYSGGMKQRLGLAQAVLGDPDILILDEPTAGLDPKQRIEIRNYISRIAMNKIMIIATHVVSDVEFIAKSIMMLKTGCLVDMASPSELIRKMKGKVWQVVCRPIDIPAIQAEYRVVNMQQTDGDNFMVKLRILADVKPTHDANMVVPTLEDCYLDVFGERFSV